MTQLLTVGRFQAVGLMHETSLSSWKVFGELMWNLMWCSWSAWIRVSNDFSNFVHSMDRFSSQNCWPSPLPMVNYVRCTGVSVLTVGVVSEFPSCLGNCSNLCQPLDTVVTEPRRINGKPEFVPNDDTINACWWKDLSGLRHEPRRRECSQTCLQR